jgi:hypothetical protein
MPNSGTNQWGAFTTPADGDTTPTYAPTATPSKPSTPPQSPSGSVTGESSTWEFANGELATSYYTSNLVSAAHDGVAFGGGDEPSPALNVAQTLPAAPSGLSYEPQGAVAISNLVSITASYAGIAPASIQVNNFGATGNV